MMQSISQTQSKLAKVSAEVANGGTISDVAGSLGGEASQLEALQQQNNYLTTLTNTNNMAATNLSATQSSLSSIASTAQSFMNNLASGLTGSSAQSALQNDAQSALTSLVGQLNSSSSGTYLFGGINSSEPPITNYTTGSSNQTADASAFMNAFGMPASSASVSTISAADMQNFLDNQFGSLYEGSNWTTNWSNASDTVTTGQISPTQTAATSVSANEAAFQQLASAYSMVANLGTQNLSSSAYQAVVSTATKTMQGAISELTDLQSSVGTVQSQITASNNQMSLNQTYIGTQIGNLDTVDTSALSVQVTDLQTQLETAYSLTSQLAQLSLVKYL